MIVVDLTVCPSRAAVFVVAVLVALCYRRWDTMSKEAMMKYMMLICTDDSSGLSRPERAEIPAATEAWVKDMDGSGIRLVGDLLRAPGDATTVRVRNAQVLLADGPFAETKEQIAGFGIIECEDLDQALDVAAKHPVARFGLIEVRPFRQ
jgi:hypothetical protein